MIIALITAVVMNGQLVYTFTEMPTMEVCQTVKAVVMAERNVVDANCAAVLYAK